MYPSQHYFLYIYKGTQRPRPLLRCATRLSPSFGASGPCSLHLGYPLPAAVHALYLTAQSLGLLLQWASYAHSSTPRPAQPISTLQSITQCSAALCCFPPIAPPHPLHWSTRPVPRPVPRLRLSPRLRLDCCSAISTSSRCVPFLPSSLFSLFLLASLSLQHR